MSAAIAEADQMLRAGKRAEAAQRIGALQQSVPERAEPWLLGARLAQMEADFAAMLSAARRGAEAAPKSVTAALIVIEAQMMCGETAAARVGLAELEGPSSADAIALRRIAEAYTHLGQHAEADRCAQAARLQRPDDLDGLFQASSCALAMGRLEEAEAMLDDLIARRPNEFDALYNRATLRHQTSERNHLSELEAVRGRIGADFAPPALHYALGKELEDLGRDGEAIDAYARGAAARRRGMSYDVTVDLTAMREIEHAFGAEFFAGAQPGFTGDAPIFVVGLPRSGTTLVDRILSAHRNVESRGEMNELALAVTRAAGKSDGKSERIAKVARADMGALGESYCRAVRGAGASGAVFLDKTPLNFLYLGVIARALPHAKIIHLTRHPMASGYAMLKTLFRMGYPFSYSQEDIGRYIAGYLALMQHWRSYMGWRVCDVAYEDIVADIEGQTRRMLGFCGLPWDPACLAFHENKQPSTTASAAQVRQPLHDRSVAKWRTHEQALRPLAETLRGEGVL